MKRFIGLVVVLLVIGGAGCATIFDGSSQIISIDSNPQGATVYTAVKNRQGVIVKKMAVGKTPLDVDVARKDGVVIIELEGYETVEAPLVRGTNPKIILDVLATSLLGTSVDVSTGAAQYYNPGEYMVELTPIDAGE